MNSLPAISAYLPVFNDKRKQIGHRRSPKFAQRVMFETLVERNDISQVFLRHWQRFATVAGGGGCGFGRHEVVDVGVAPVRKVVAVVRAVKRSRR